MVYYRPRKITTDFILSRDEEIHKNLLKFFKGAEKYFEENEMEVEIRGIDKHCKEINIEEIISSN